MIYSFKPRGNQILINCVKSSLIIYYLVPIKIDNFVQLFINILYKVKSNYICYFKLK